MSRKVRYTKEAKSHDEQIAILRTRGVIIKDEKKAKEYLSDIGYYRLGFYSFPFEVTYPETGRKRRRDVKPETTIEDIVALYYYDNDLRIILNRYLSRIEVSIRATIIYQISLKYRDNPFWFVSPSVMNSSFVKSFDKEVYSHIKNKPTIRNHHKKYEGKYAPSWKTMEFMTLGNLETLYANLLLDKDKKLISSQFGEPAVSVFKSYLSAIREIRNACAHGNVIYELRLVNGIMQGVACPHFRRGESQNLIGTLRVVYYMMNRISANRAKEMHNELVAATVRLNEKVPSIKDIIQTRTGIVI